MPGAIEALLEAVGARPRAGIVSLKAIASDGALLHAGGMVDQDGLLGFFGQLQHPDRPEFNYTRECHFAPPPALFVSRDCWASGGEIVEHYTTPAYAAAALAMRVCAEGYQVIYEPRAAVICAKPGTQSSADELTVRAERAKFAREYAGMLRSRFAEPLGQPLMRRDHLARGPMMLVVDHYVPEPDVDAGSRNIVEFLRTFLAMGYLVKFWPKDLDPSEPYTRQLQALGIEVMHGPFVYSFSDWVKTHGANLDIVLLSRPTVAPDLIPALRRHTRAKLVYYGHDLHFERMQREAHIKQDRRIAKAAARMRRTESEIWKAVDMVLYPSQEEIDTVNAIAPRANAHFVPPFQFDSFQEPGCATSGLGILFVAGFQHAPNVDAACWFVEHVMPLVLARHPQACLTLAGSNPTPEVLALGQVPSVEVTGKLSSEQLAARYQHARVAAVPLRFGAGVKLKVVEAMQQGVPLVTTRTGLQGLPGVMSVVPPTDDARSMAQRITELLDNDAAWLDSSRAQSLYVAQHFSTSAMRKRFETLFGSISQQQCAEEPT